jgi:hypothetical protein
MRVFLRPFLSVLLLFNLSCQKSSVPVSAKYTTWINPITQVKVSLPKGWRHSLATAQKGATAIGYFAPQFAAVKGKYGHVTFHYEDMRRVEEKRTLRYFVDNFSAHMHDQMFNVSEPKFSKDATSQIALVIAEGRYKGRNVRLNAQFWTANEQDFWYSITESEVTDTQLAEDAKQVVEHLVDSTSDLGED